MTIDQTINTLLNSLIRETCQKQRELVVKRIMELRELKERTHATSSN